MKKDIENIDDIKLMVNSFYGKIRDNGLLGPIFEDKIQNRWPAHLEKMYRFWQTILLNEHSYNGAPFNPHASMPIDKTHFEVWIEIFKNTVDELFEGPVSDEAKNKGTLMATIFNSKIEYLKNNANKGL